MFFSILYENSSTFFFIGKITLKLTDIYLSLNRSNRSSQPHLATLHILTLLTKGLKWLSYYPRQGDKPHIYDAFASIMQMIYHMACTLCFLLVKLHDPTEPYGHGFYLKLKQAVVNYSDSSMSAFITILYEWSYIFSKRSEFITWSVNILSLFHE